MPTATLSEHEKAGQEATLPTAPPPKDAPQFCVETPSQYRQLQAEAKQRGIHANRRKAELEEQLAGMHAPQYHKGYKQQPSQQHEKAGGQEAPLATASPPKDARTSTALGQGGSTATFRYDFQVCRQGCQQLCVTSVNLSVQYARISIQDGYLYR
jgi:hypothetical protein